MVAAFSNEIEISDWEAGNWEHIHYQPEK